ncbi:hypothetical protein PUMCH_000738 [Australozyma saopauloensis]|uniref:RNase III domain-containing protein n=1 Tax=Australozyma saopauloensis TaxID=291208 RepID=A0AAX4H4X1_9ASCO|nr:hypothetical protein PUMCH_000738 [[Candida] saopauloensis]
MLDLESLLTWCDDLHQVRGNVSQLQATLNQILAKAPTVPQYLELVLKYGDQDTTLASPIQEKVRASLHLPQLKVAVRLKNLFDKGLLPFLLGMSRINFKSPKCDRFVGYLLDYCPPKQDVANISVDLESKQVKSAFSVDTALYPPLLPPIENKALLRLVFTDKSMRLPMEFIEMRKSMGTNSFNNTHNRKLALKGRYLLDQALIDILDDLLPDLHEDDIEALRYQLTSTAILAKLAYIYNFPEALCQNVPMEADTQTKLEILKTVFLAYIGALPQDNYRHRQIIDWLWPLFKPLVKPLLEKGRSEGGLKSRVAVAWAEFQFLMGRLNNYFMHSIKRIPYEFVIHDENPYVGQLMVGGLAYCFGTGDTLLEAKQWAAFKTLNDTNFKERLFTYLCEQMQLHSDKRTPKHRQDLEADKITVPRTPAELEPQELKSTTSGAADGAQEKGMEETGHVRPFNPPLGPKMHTAINLAKAPLAPLNQPRMPLQYGMIPPPLPNPKRK